MTIAKLILGLLGASCIALGAAAQDSYPNRPIRFIIPFPPGGGADLLARTVSAQLTQRWKVPVVVDNKPGGNTIIAAEAAATAPADGHTVFVAIDSTLAMNQSLYARLPYDPIKSFAPVTLAVDMPMVLAVYPGVPARTVPELLAMAQASPGKMADAFDAMPAQVAGAAFQSASKADMLPVPYKGSAPAMADTAGGQVPVIFDALGPAMSFVKSDKVRALAVTGAQRNRMLPDVPTLAESGAPGLDLTTWIGLVVPAGVDTAITKHLNQEVVSILQLPQTRQIFSNVGMTVIASTPEQFAQAITNDAQKFGRIIKEAGIRLD